jgi:hypothetical protein
MRYPVVHVYRKIRVDETDGECVKYNEEQDENE